MNSKFALLTSLKTKCLLPEIIEHELHARAGSRLKIIVTGGHPDDPETGCGGTMAICSGLGHELVAMYLTRGEAGIKDKSSDEVAQIRTIESYRSCDLLKARPVFVEQVDGESELSKKHYEEFKQFLEPEEPDIVFTHWPVDSHRDHRTMALLVLDAWLELEQKFSLYFYEVLSGRQTSLFHPTHYVDITPTEPIKQAACFSHTSQNPEEFYAAHNIMSRFRGMECGCEHAEAFIRHSQ